MLGFMQALDKKISLLLRLIDVNIAANSFKNLQNLVGIFLIVENHANRPK